MQEGVDFGKKCSKCCSAGICNADCCGVIPFDRDLIKRNTKNVCSPVVEYIDVGKEGVVPMTSDLKCLFLDRGTNRCSIYEERPQVCKDYGTGVSEDLLCPHLKPSGNPRTEASSKQITKGIDKMINMLERKRVIHNL